MAVSDLFPSPLEKNHIAVMPPDLAQWLLLIRSNYPCLEHFFMVPKVFEPLKFYCSINISVGIQYRAWSDAAFWTESTLFSCVPKTGSQSEKGLKGVLTTLDSFRSTCMLSLPAFDIRKTNFSGNEDKRTFMYQWKLLNINPFLFTTQFKFELFFLRTRQFV